MQIAIIQNSQSSACDNKMTEALLRAGMEPIDYVLGQSDLALPSCQGYVVIEAEKQNHALLETLKREIEAGKPVLGIGLGARFLIESGLVPGLPDYRVGITLNDREPVLVDQCVYLRLSEDYQFNAFTQKLMPKDILCNPLSDNLGSFVIPPGLLYEMRIQGLTVFQYCTAQGEAIISDNIAAVSNKVGNVMAMLSHPEMGGYGDKIFHSMHDYIAEGHVQQVSPLHYFPRH
ncbi:MAG: phosphoribosylformylglycinamidine synthase subunit PurQ [Gammaproteobacteria bacterium]|nr:phosphoribosylformylglycinamidine synthase subunit PurQ [Gammaproteobacteria bacterium]